MERALRSGRTVPALLLLLAFVLGAQPSGAQGLFGQNKIQYSDFEWRVMKTPHVDIHFYPEEEEIARWVAQVVEEASEEFLAEMNLELERPVPFLLYSTPSAFRQTNASPYMIGEETGGLTDLIKGRVMVPHNGSYHMLRWVVRHELVHAFMLEKLRQVLKDNKKTRYSYPPLWYVEGLAEFMSTSWDSRADMIVRDAVINGRLVPIPRMWQISGTFQMYKQGQSILLFIEREYGREKVLQYLEEWYRDMSFAELTEEILGVTLEDLSEDWEAELKRKYYRQVKERDSIEVMGNQLVEHGAFNLRPCPLPSADDDNDDDSLEFIFLSSYEGFTNIRRSTYTPGVRPKRGPEPELLIKGGTSETFESLHFFRNSMDTNADRELAFVSQKGARDVIHIFDVDRRRLTQTLGFEEIVALRAPAWSPDREWLAFSGVDKHGHRDIYLARRDGSNLEAITDDGFDDLDPDWSPDGKSIVFASDRCLGGEHGAYNLYGYDTDTHALTQLTSGAFEDTDPAWSPDGEYIAFRSNRADQAYDLWVINRAGELRAVAQAQTALEHPEWSEDGKSLLCTSFLKGAFAVFQVPIAPEALPPRESPPTFIASKDHETVIGPGRTFETRSVWSPSLPDTTYSIGAYQRRFGLDLVSGGVAYDPEFGNSAGGGQIVLSDLLGNERLQFFIANDGGGGGGGSFLGSFDVGFTYFNMARRLNWGVGAFRLSRTYNADLDLFLRESRVGGVVTASYPISRFNRIETSVVFRTISDHLYRSGIQDDTFLISNFFSYVHDTTLWSYRGPFSGTRYNITFGTTTDISKGLGDFHSVQLDFRRYTRLLPRMTHSFRTISRMSFGREGPAYFIGGPFTLRGFPRRSIVGQRLVVVNNEVRFPIIERLLANMGPALVDLPLLNGATFFDVAWAAYDERAPMNAWGSYGIGVFIGGGPFPRLRLDWSWLTDFETAYFRRDTEFSVGFDF